MISLELSAIQENAPRASALSDAVAAFVAAGGVIDVLPGPGFVPRPVHRQQEWNGRAVKGARPAPRPKKIDPREQAQQDLLLRAREIVAFMTMTEAAQHLGVSYDTVGRLSRQYDLQFQKRGRHVITDDEELRLVERIGAFADIGITRAVAAGRLGVCSQVVIRLAKKHGIEFKKCGR